ncbi:F390 synthetase-related protein [Paenibacillus rigui]|uniref:F390 synthetase-related protein n=1 Tax=Paenibacillus rigui TaxID=554312 RepID=UPI0026A43F0B
MKLPDTWHIVWHYMLTLYRQRWVLRDRRRLEAWQEKRIRRQVRSVRAQSAFYRAWWAERPEDAWRSYPVIDKSVMMEHLDQLNTARIGKQEAMELAVEAERTREFTPTIGEVTVGLSSGTSGHRGLFLVSRRERLAWAGTVLAKILPGPLLGRHRIAFFLRANSNLYGSVGSRRIQFQFYDLLDPIEEHVARLCGQQPSLLVAPASMLRLLADMKRAGRLPLHPQKLVSVAEVLDPLDRRIIEGAFGQPVHQVYQCTEGFLAATCAHGTLHLNEDIVYVQKEYVDRDAGRFVPILTDFSRTTQPIVRYRLNDLLTERREPCPCGSPLTAIERIEGRCDDIFAFRAAGGDRLIPIFPDFITRALLAASPEITAYHAVLHAPDRLVVALEIDDTCRDAAQAAVVKSLQALCERTGTVLPAVDFEAYRHVSGERKLRRVERRFTLDSEWVLECNKEREGKCALG